MGRLFFTKAHVSALKACSNQVDEDEVEGDDESDKEEVEVRSTRASDEEDSTSDASAPQSLDSPGNTIEEGRSQRSRRIPVRLADYELNEESGENV